MQIFLGMLVVSFSLYGCDTETRSKINNVLYGSKDNSVSVTEPLYCYKTIGKVNCYSEPLKGEEANRLIGYDGVSPRTTSGSGVSRH